MFRRFFARVVRAFSEEKVMQTRTGAPAITRDTADAMVNAMPQHQRVTKELIDSKIKESRHFLDGTLTVCVIEMRNGFKFVGTSACVDPANFNEEVGVRIAYDNAYRQIWSHEGYCLADLISDDGHAAQREAAKVDVAPAADVAAGFDPIADKALADHAAGAQTRATDGQGAFHDEKPGYNPHVPPSD